MSAPTMKTAWTARLRRFLRSPAVITGELVVLTAFGVAGATTGRDALFGGAGFMAAVALTAVSLLVVTVDQVRRFMRTWAPRRGSADFQAARYRAEFERPAAGAGGGTRIRAEHRIGAAGGPLLHVGLLLLIAAGAVRALFGAGAVVDLLEGETLPPEAAAWLMQKPGRLAEPIALPTALALQAVEARRYGDGDLQQLSVRLQAAGEPATELPVNGSLMLDGTRVYVGSECGPAALVEWSGPGGASVRTAALLQRAAGARFEKALAGPGGARAHLRAEPGPGGARPDRLEVRVMNGPALAFAGQLRPGASVALPDGGRLTLHGLPGWVRLHASRDPSLPLLYAGLALLVLGVTLHYLVIRVDLCVAVTPAGARERVFVALQPQRFPELFAERFQRLVEAEQAPARPARAPARGLVGVPQAALLLAVLCLPAMTGCRGVSRQEARGLVERYNRVVSEAYRRGDIKLVDGVVGEEEGRKLTGLIGVRLDMGLTLDSQMTALDVVGIEPEGDRLRVRTRETWRYCDRRIGTGEAVGEVTEDRYAMRYHFMRADGAWLVERIEFAEPPQSNRKLNTWAIDHGAMVQAAGEGPP